MITLTEADLTAATNIGDFIAHLCNVLAQKNNVQDPARYIDSVTDYLFDDFPRQYPALFGAMLAKMAG